eukprot:TRINITY_DN62722_c0_g1_i1.p1 TRINITY_DN62722_c0_g1~~TRINITY_DN62722_c0_g1_i1.p1  ORF type:complete len:176 (-),score=21.57 TRINITY_DN62722_c0_g1_i1:56-583(-)
MLRTLLFCKVAACMLMLAVGGTRLLRGKSTDLGTHAALPLAPGTKSSDFFSGALVSMEDVAAQANASRPCPFDVSTTPLPPYAHTETTSQEMLMPLQENQTSGSEANATEQRAMKDCIVTDWTGWGECAADAMGERMAYLKKRSRVIIQPRLDGGNPCPPLEEVATCKLNEILSR